MNRNIATFLFTIVLATTLWAGIASAEEDPYADVLATLTEQLALSEDQQPEVGNHLAAFGQGLDAASQEAEAEEPDTKKMIGGVKKARDDFKSSMKKTLDDEQFATFEGAMESTIQGMFNDIAAIKIMDLEPVLGLTDDQSAALEPIIGGGLRSIVGLIFENADKRLSKPKKIKLGRALKGIQSEMDKGIAGVLNEEQNQQYQAMKAEKEASK